MTMRTISCCIIVFASTALLFGDAHSRTAVFIPDPDHLWIDESAMPPVDMPHVAYVSDPGYNSAATKPHTTQSGYSSPYMNQPLVPYTDSPYTPPTWASPWNRGYSTYGTPAYDPLPPIPTGPPRSPFYVEPHGQNWVPSSRPSAFPVRQAPIRKPFSDYRPQPVISPYMYFHYDDPFGVPDYYFMKPLLEEQKLEQP